MFPSLLPDNVMTLPIGYLHLEKRVHNALIRARVITIGLLIDAFSINFAEVDNFGSAASANVSQAITALAECVDSNNVLNWRRFWEIQNVVILPTGYKADSPAQIIGSLPSVIKSVLCFQDDDDRQWRIIQRRFGLDGTQRLTLDDLGAAYGLTRERVRQLERAALNELRNVLIESNYGGKAYHVHPDILIVIKSIFDRVSETVKDFILETDLFDLLKDFVDGDDKSSIPALTLLFHLFGMNRIDFEIDNLTAMWEYSETGQREAIGNVVKLLNTFLTREKIAPMEEFDILFNLNSKLPKAERLTALQLRKYLLLCSSVERRADGLIQGKFECLRNRGDQVERVLLEAGGPLHITVIVREINKRVTSGRERRKIGARSIANQLSRDNRFVNLGHSGQWGLAAWKHLQTANIATLMEECLISLNRPATVEEILEYVAARRPVRKNSIEMYLMIMDNFKKADRIHWGLSTWQETQNAAVWSPEQVADFVIKVFKERRTKEMEFTVIRQALMTAANVSARQARGMLAVNPVIKTRREPNSRVTYAQLNPGFRKDMLGPNLRVKRKSETTQQKAERAVKDILEAESNRQMELRLLVARMKNEYGILNKTCYAYIARMSFVEKIDLPGSTTKICRFKGPQTLYFPQLAKLRAIEPSAADEATRAIERLTIDDVDIGLFMLGRLFENTLKGFMIIAEKVKVYPVNPGNYSKLNNMIDWVKAQGIISDPTILHFLRQERNERAHGLPPSFDERQMLMGTAAWLAGLYLDHILFFCLKKKNLVTASGP